MDPKTIESIWKAFQEVQEGKHKKEAKLDPVDKDELKGKHSDRKDKDIDNDGDVDSSDEYLHNRRKAVSKAIKKDDKKDDVKESEESPYPSLDKKKREKKGSNLEDAGGPAAKLKGESVEHVIEAKVECPKCKGKGCDHCDDKGYHMKEGKVPPQFLKNIKKKKGEDGDDEEETKDESSCGKKVKESNLFSADELAALEEKMKQPGDTGTPAEPFMSTNSGNDKKQMAAHRAGSDKKLEDYEEMGEMDAVKAGKGGPGQSPARRGDNRNSEPMKSVAKK